jgi:hypothetical protein
MKKQLLWCMAALSFSAASAQTYETRFARPLSDVLNDVAARFQVRLKYDVDTVGRVLPYADFRIRPYSLEETLTNVLSPFDYKFVKQSSARYSHQICVFWKEQALHPSLFSPAYHPVPDVGAPLCGESPCAVPIDFYHYINH